MNDELSLDIIELKTLYKRALARVEPLYQITEVFPPKEEILSSLSLLELKDIKVVIVAQDPYHGVGEAHGLAFSVKESPPLPPSLKNIFKELKSDLNIPISIHGDLRVWRDQGVLLLNRVLTVEKDKPRSHVGLGWEDFTEKLIYILNKHYSHIVFILWGNDAKLVEPLLDSEKHCILTATHPSPFSANKGFFGCKHFSKTNEYLISVGKTPIKWEL